MEFLIYLDVCCLNRPFDDQTQERIRLEAEAVLLILTNFELRRTPDEDRKRQMTAWNALAMTKISITEQIELRVSELKALGFKVFDASHIACAEAGNAAIFLTTDDRMLRLAARHSAMLQVRVENPLRWVLEVTP
jgi:predicted nucleic acid-binding protein